MKISASNISVSRTNLSGDTFVGAGGVNSTTAASAYPSDWAWSCNFAHSAAIATHVAAEPYNTGSNITTFVADKGVQEQRSDTSMTAVYSGGFRPASLPDGSFSGTLGHGQTGPNGTLDLASAKYLTVYFEIIALGTAQPADGFGESMYWRASSEASGNASDAISRHNVVRKTVSHKGSTTSGNFAVGEFISISYDMSDEANETGDAWAASTIGTIGGSMTRGPNQNGAKVIYHGYIVSNLDNSNESIASIDLPIAVS